MINLSTLHFPNPLLFFITVCLLAMTQPVLAEQQTGHKAMVTNKNTVFHRLYIIGKKNDNEAKSVKEKWVKDTAALKKVLETDKAQASGSTSTTLDEPKSGKILLTIVKLAKRAKPGEEIFIYYTGHGGGGAGSGEQDSDPATDELFDETINADGVKGFKDDGLRIALKKIKKNVSVTVFLDSCYGGGFTGGKDDFKEGRLYKVIGTRNECYSDDGQDDEITTFTEALIEAVNGAGDYNGDGSLTADEAKRYLGMHAEGFLLGPPDDTKPPPKKKKKAEHKQQTKEK